MRARRSVGGAIALCSVLAALVGAVVAAGAGALTDTSSVFFGVGLIGAGSASGYAVARGGSSWPAFLTVETLLRFGLGLFGVLMGGYRALYWPADYGLHLPAMLYTFVAFYILLSAFVPQIRWPRRKRGRG